MTLLALYSLIFAFYESFRFEFRLEILISLLNLFNSNEYRTIFGHLISNLLRSDSLSIYIKSR